MDLSTEESGPKFPNVFVQLTGEDGNAVLILGKVRRALKEDPDAGPEAADEFFAEATSGDYDHLLATCMRWVDVG